MEQFIRSVPLFSFVGPDDVPAVLRLLRPLEVKAGDVLFREGEPGHAMWVLTDTAEVTVSSVAGHGRPVVVAYARQGDVVGELALVDDGPRSSTAVVTRDGRALQLDASAFHALRDTFVPVVFKVLRRIALDLCVRLRQPEARAVASSGSPPRTPSLPGQRNPDSSVLDQFPPFRSQPSLAKLALSRQFEVVQVNGTTPLFAEGEPGDSAWFILDGEVAVGRHGRTLRTLKAGSMFGIVACVDDGLRSASCVATGPARFLRITNRDFDVLFESGHRFAYQLVDLITRQLVEHVRNSTTLPSRPGEPVAPELPPVVQGTALDLLPLELDLDLDQALPG